MGFDSMGTKNDHGLQGHDRCGASVCEEEQRRLARDSLERLSNRIPSRAVGGEKVKEENSTVQQVA